MACVQRRPVQTSAEAHVLHPTEVQLITVTVIIVYKEIHGIDLTLKSLVNFMFHAFGIVWT